MRARRRLSRRRFLKGAAAALAAPYVITSAALGLGGRPPAGDRIVMGAIGVGSMGRHDLGAFLRFGQVQVVAVCEVDARRRERACGMVEDHYAMARPSGTWRGCDAYNDFRDLLARPDIDAVTIATPDHWHALPVIAAARAGKDIHCQKPLSLTIAEGRAMCDAVRRYGRVFQTGSQQRSDGRFRFACELVRSGRIGRLATIRVGLPTGPQTVPLDPMPVPPELDYDLWLGPAPWAPYTPARCHGSFRYVRDYSGGPVTDWGAHHNDIAQWGSGHELSGPVEIEGTGLFPDEGLYNTAVHYEFTCTYADGVRLICTDRFPNGVRFEGDGGWIFVSRGRMDAEPASLLDESIRPEGVHLYESRDHKANFLECIRTRGPTAAPAEIAHRSVTVCHLGNIAMLLGRRLRWDPAKEEFPGDEEANRMRGRAMREPWRL